MDVVILAGGFGKRILPLTHYLPKPMLPIANRPAIDYLIAQATHAGADEIILTLSYMSKTIIAHTNGYLDANIRYCHESTPLGTAGGVKNAQPRGDFAVLCGDGISDIDLNAMMRLHNQTNAMVTIAVSEVDDLAGFGKVITDGQLVQEFAEKDEGDRGKSGLANTGVYIVSEKVFKYINGNCDFGKDLFPLLLGRGEKIATYRHAGYWQDIGNCAAYLKTNLDLLNGGFFPRARHVDGDAGRMRGTSFLGRGVILSGRANNSVLGQDSIICSNADIADCVVLSGAVVSGHHRNEIIGSRFCIEATKPDINRYNFT